METVVDMRKRMRNVIVASWLIVLSFVMIAMFWYNVYEGSATQVPERYKQASTGAAVNPGSKVALDHSSR